MKRIFLLLVSSVVGICMYAATDDMVKAREAFLRMTLMDYSPDRQVAEKFVKLSDDGRANDVMLLQLYMAVHLPDAEVERLIELFDWEAKGWKDVDYAANKRGRWPPTFHVTRMYALAKSYKAGNERWRGSEQLKKLLHACLDKWYEEKPVCPNWWHNEIGVPKKFAAVMLMLQDELSQEEIEGGLRVLEHAKFGMTGQNKMWLAGNNLMKGLFLDDEALVEKACAQIKETIFVTEEEGIQPDWSFHQHGPQIQFGNYGLAFVDGLSFWMSVLKGTKFDFTDEQKEITANLIKEGVSWCVYKGYLDPSFCGRQNFINAGKGKACAFATVARNMAEAGREDADFFENLYNSILSPDKYPNTLTGERYYWRSDCGICRRPDWYASVRMHSSRTVGFEFTNRENTLGNFSADGAVLLMQDGEEFTDIFGFWDWRKVPGVTAYDDGLPMKSDNNDEKKKNRSEHVGGLTHDGVMASTMEINRDGLVALKSAFFFDDCVVNIGAGIKGSKDMFKTVTTSVDQIHLTDGGFKSEDNWAWHADRGYLCLDGAAMNVTGELQKGKWDYIEPSFVNKWDEGKVFKCWFEHPMDKVDAGEAGYAYAIFPRTSIGQMKKITGQFKRKGAAKHLRVLQNDEDCQAVMYKGSICAVFHQPGKYDLGSFVYEASEPMVLIRTDNGEKKVSLPERAVK